MSFFVSGESLNFEHAEVFGRNSVPNKFPFSLRGGNLAMQPPPAFLRVGGEGCTTLTHCAGTLKVDIVFYSNSSQC